MGNEAIDRLNIATNWMIDAIKARCHLAGLPVKSTCGRHASERARSEPTIWSEPSSRLHIFGHNDAGFLHKHLERTSQSPHHLYLHIPNLSTTLWTQNSVFLQSRIGTSFASKYQASGWGLSLTDGPGYFTAHYPAPKLWKPLLVSHSEANGHLLAQLPMMIPVWISLHRLRAASLHLHCIIIKLFRGGSYLERAPYQESSCVSLLLTNAAILNL